MRRDGQSAQDEAPNPAPLAGVEPLFTRRGEEFVPSAHTRGPWDAASQHGGAPAALLARAIERLEPGADMLVSRITFDFLSAVPLEPLSVEARVARPGRRFQLADAELRCAAGVVARARAVRLRRGSVELPDVARADGMPFPGPQDAAPRPFPANTGEEGFHRTGMEIRWIEGSYAEAGPARAWFRFARPLVEGEQPSPLALVAAASDFGNGVSRVLEFSEHLFVNTDLTVHLHRQPRGEWVLLDSRTVADEMGVAVSRSALFDEQGPIGLAAQTLFVEER